MSYINFESSRVKEHAREEKRIARELLLEKAEEGYNRRKQAEERRKERGEDKWILPSVDARLKTKAKEMRREKNKKKKNKKKKKRERKSSSSSSSSSSEEDQWVERKMDNAPSSGEQKDRDEPSKSTTSQTKERDEWMSMPGLFPCVTRDKLREKTRTKSEAELKRDKEKYMLDSLGQSDRELNPYWKGGGCGLPQTPVDSSSVSLASKNVGDGGANWLRRALERAKQQAAEEGRSLEDVAAERWGSLKKLESLIEEAENRTRHPRSHHREQTHYRGRGGFRKPDENSMHQRSYASSQSSGQRNWRKKDTSSHSRSEEPRRRKSPSPPSSSSSSSDEAEPAKEDAPAAVLTEKELNELGAKLVKAELMGNETLAAELQRKLDAARAARKDSKQAPTSSKQEEETVILTRTDSRGFVRPLEQHAYPEPSGGRRKKQKVETHADGKRIRYFADDDKYSLQEMFQREKLSTVEDQNEAFAKLAAKGIGRPDSEYDMDDVFAEHARMKESDGKTQARERDRAIREHKRTDRALENCSRCFGSKSTMKHLIVAIGTKTYLCLPPHQSLTTGHCLIVPMFHVPCATQLDEDVWAEMQTFRKALTAMFSKMDEDVVFFETAMYLGRFPHMALECVPMPKETGDLAPIYFKKAILECEMEWSNNKKVVDLSKKDVRRAIPKGLPYFSVDFGLEGGFAHVIEDEKLFPQNFAQEIIGGMLDLDHSLWRKQRRENFDIQCKKVVEFAKLWKPYDFTQKESSRD